MNAAQFDCRWCGKSAHEHGPAGESKLGGPHDRLCPRDDYGAAVSSQFYTPKCTLRLGQIKADLVKAKAAIDLALATIREVLDA